MLERSIELASNEFVSKIRESAIYKEYREKLQKLKEYPDYYQKVNEFRLRNYEMQNATQVDDLFEKMDAFEKEYEKFRENPLVEEFLQAELAFCRMMQEVDIAIMEKLDFE